MTHHASGDSISNDPVLTGPAPLPVEALRWRCPSDGLDFESTADLDPSEEVIGQETAVEALRFGLESRASGQNIFVRGLSGTGRTTLLRRLLRDLNPTCPTARDRCYVHNFGAPERPRLVSVPRGKGAHFKRLADQLADFVRDDLKQALNTERVMRRKSALDQSAQEKVKAVVGPLESALAEVDLALVTMQVGAGVHTSLFPVIDDQPVPPEQFEAMHAKGEVDEDRHAAHHEARERFAPQLHDLNKQLYNARQEYATAFQELLEEETRAVITEFIDRIRVAFPEPSVHEFLDELTDDVIERVHEMAGSNDAPEDFSDLYRVNVVLQHQDDRCPIIIENTPTLANLLGAVDREIGPMGVTNSDHHMVRGGSLLRADSGYLIIDARDLLSEAGAWKVLVRTLRTGRLEIIPPEMTLPWTTQPLNPEPIDINVKVILIGDAQIYHVLDQLDPDFPHLFKVLADFSSVIDRDPSGAHQYARVLARIAHEESLPAFARDAVCALVEHGARIAERRGKLTARFGRLADLAREAAFLCGKDGSTVVNAEHVREAIQRTKRRADLPSRRFRELLTDGTIRIQTTGTAIGQVNGLAVTQAGPLRSGFPARITSTIGVGSAGLINIEREAALSGAIHTKGFYILDGLLRHLLRTDHPFAISASIAFEQSYGGIDGDSASGAEICCLISALTGIPVRQDLAMTGAIDQFGNIMSIGAVNEKIEGFFDVCRGVGLTGTQGVIIPASNAGELMLRPDVAEACAEGQFAVYAVQCIHEAIALFTGRPAGRREDESGHYPESTVLARAVEEARRFWERAAPPRPPNAPPASDPSPAPREEIVVHPT